VSNPRTPAHTLAQVVALILARKPKMCNFLEWKEHKVVYKRYASLYFCCAIDADDNELIALEIIHRYVELLDKYFGSVCELDVIFNFEKVRPPDAVQAPFSSCTRRRISSLTR
jgi:hypothetical protein